MGPVHLIVVVDFDKDDTGTLCLGGGQFPVVND